MAKVRKCVRICESPALVLLMRSKVSALFSSLFTAVLEWLQFKKYTHSKNRAFPLWVVAFFPFSIIHADLLQYATGWLPSAAATRPPRAPLLLPLPHHILLSFLVISLFCRDKYNTVSSDSWISEKFMHLKKVCLDLKICQIEPFQQARSFLTVVWKMMAHCV